MGKFCSNGKDVLDQLDELNFSDGHMYSLPPSALRLTPTLHIARFMNCHFPSINDEPPLLLPGLKHSKLIAVASLMTTWITFSITVLHSSTFIFRPSIG
ncbi:hypothetical protein D1007_21467 [Hordeum vulgare]|nr:hypothetical protein D1007_59200 [Hordeum vulgare]KAE8802648.1 hypothetical protein D1007_21467 [Hordeum vulgare]